ncbi:MAG TPA: hypothetical protein VHK06_02795 [Candidatus Limnocylindria bacterium]|nr:hypothetical protein [Candidatus Limnocylindria bacterium]
MLYAADLDRLVEERQARLRGQRRPTVAGTSLRRRIGRTLITAGVAIAGERGEQPARPSHLRPARPAAS